MRTGVAVACVVALAAGAACGGTTGGLFRQYEYEEEMFLALDGSATIFVSSSIPALNALRGTSFDARPGARVDRDAVREYFSSPATRVTRVSTSRRGGSQFVHVRLDVEDVKQLGQAAPFGWSSYQLDRDADLVAFRQTVGPPAARDSPDDSGTSWSGEELVAFRVHIPSVVVFHNAGRANLRRGNILVWEQRLEDRLKGVPLTLEARMQPQSILYRTLSLFAAAFAAVALMFGLIVWRIARKGRKMSAAGRTTQAGPAAP